MPSCRENLKQVLFLCAAPMAGISTPIYRVLCRAMGATLAFSEMISAKGLVKANTRTHEILSVDGGEHPVAAQLFGNEPGIMADAAEMVAEAGFDLIDINMGCPVRKVVSTGAGCALMNDPPLAARIVRAMVDRVDLPITAKIRSGWSATALNATSFSLRLEDAGLHALTVHGRTREQGYAGKADWACIAEVKSRLEIPVVGNGDVEDGASALELLRSTGCDGVMIGRAALGNPFVFREISGFLDSGSSPPPPGREERYQAFVRHAQGLVRELGPERGTRHLRKFGSWYIRGFRGAPAARAALHRCRTAEEVSRIVQSVLLGPGPEGDPISDAGTS